MKRRGFVASIAAMVAAKKFGLPQRADSVVWERDDRITATEILARREDFYAGAHVRTGLPSVYWRLINQEQK